MGRGWALGTGFWDDLGEGGTAGKLYIEVPVVPCTTMRRDLIQSVRGLLSHTGFLVSEPSRLRPMAFDVVARRDDDLLIIKVLTNVDSLSPEVAEELLTLSKLLEGRPLLVGARASSRELEPGVLYARHGVPIVTLDTLEEYLVEGLAPLVYAAPGGFYVDIDGRELRRIREEQGYSLGELASVAGVSRRAISMYEEGMGAMVDVAAKLEEYLEAPIVRALDPLDGGGTPGSGGSKAEEHEVQVLDLRDLADALEREVYHAMERMGFQIVPVGRSPFNAISRSGEEDVDHLVLTGISEMDRRLKRRARVMANVSEVTERVGAVFVHERRTKLHVEGIPLIDQEELTGLDGIDAVLELIKERQQREVE